MGTFVCNICSKKEEEIDDDYYKKFKKAKNSIKTDLKISMNNSSGIMLDFQFLNRYFFEKNPLEDYELIRKISPTKYQVIEKLNKGIKLFEKLSIMECIEQYCENINYVMNDIFFKLNDKCIVKIKYIYKFSDKLYVVYDNVENNLLKGEKMDFSIKDRKEIIEILFNIVNYIHGNNLYNIGLNLDTIILQKKNKKKILKKKSKDGKKLNSNQNDIAYSISVSIVDILQSNYNLESFQFYSPEIIKQIFKDKIYTKDIYTENKNDEWSCGIFLYYLITGEFPFKGEYIDKMNLDLSSNKFNNSNENEKDLLLKLLEKDENKRISIQECLVHPFIKENLEQLSTEENCENIENQKEENEENEEKELKEKIIEEEKENEKNEYIDIDLLKKLLNIQKPINKLQEMAIAYLSYHLINEEEKIRIKNLFNSLDKDKDNKITEEDIIYAFNKNKIEFTQEQINQILNVFDYDPNLGINDQIFLRYLSNKDELFKEENLKKLFDDIDENKNNYIDENEIFNFITDESLINIVFEANFLEQLGIKKDDKITYEEFSNLVINNKIPENK